MGQLLVRNLDDDVKEKLRQRARRHGRSTEEEVRTILRDVVMEESHSEIGLGSQIAAIFAECGLNPDEEIPEQRGYPAKPADFD
jgi:plasmid stability protein